MHKRGFDVIATAHVTGEAYGAFFTPDGVPLERTVPFELDISNRASGVTALPIEYVPPVVTVGANALRPPACRAASTRRAARSTAGSPTSRT